MSDRAASSWRRAAAAGCFVFLTVASAAAQQTQGIVETPTGAQFFSRFDFNMSAAKLAHPDQRFSWDTHWAGDFDLVDYVYGRVTFIADYQALLGSEFRPFDPYQSSYTLEAAGSYRLGRTELVGVLNHVSRHFGDRFKRIAIAENSLGPRVMRRFSTGTNSVVELRADVRKVIARAYVDYNWFSTVDILVRQDVRRRASIYTRLSGQSIAVDRTVAGRGRQSGGRLEAGVVLKGTAGRVELFFGAERVPDADQLDRLPRRWAFAGFRLLGN